MSKVKYSDVKVKLIDEDGNAFSIIGKVGKAISCKHGTDAARAFTTEAFSADSYTALLSLVQRTVTVT